MTRRYLFVSATSMMHFSRKESDLRDWALSVRERAGHRRASVALARKLATVMLAMWKSGADFVPHRPPADQTAQDISGTMEGAPTQTDSNPEAVLARLGVTRSL